MAVLFQAVSRLSIFVCCLAFAIPAPLSAQYRVTEAPAEPAFLSRYDFHLSAAALASGDDRFLWDTHWGGDFDLVDYVSGRVTLLADYQAVLGNQFQPFDPNQGNYTLAAASSVRLPTAELVLFFNHVSRHLGDRPKEFGIAWNVIGVRAMKDVTVGSSIISMRLEGGKVTHRAYVDYTWTSGLEVAVRRPVSPRVGWFGRIDGEVYGRTPRVAGRHGAVGGGHAETGVRLAGVSGALELFVGYGRVVDADPIDRQPGHWAYGGFRVLGG
jgi:hypothetical protein